MKQIINGKLYDTDKCKFEYDVTDTAGNEYAIGKTPRGAWIAVEKKNKALIGPKQTKMFLGYQFPDLYIKLFGRVREG